MKISEIKERLTNGSVITVNRDRAAIDGETISRKVVDRLIEDETIVKDKKINNFTNSYKIKG